MSDAVAGWGPDQLGELVALTSAALPAESVSVDDLEALCFGPWADDADGTLGTTVVLADPHGAGATIVSARPAPAGADEVRAALQLLVVHPARRRRGVARRLVTAAERWAVDRGAARLQVGAAAPVYLFTGVDATWTEALCCFESLGYQRSGIELDLVCPTRSTGRAAVPTGVAVQRPSSEAEVAQLGEWSRRCWPHWSVEFAIAAQAGTVLVACEEGTGEVVGAAAHSVGRLGVVGPVAVDPARHGRGVGAALMAGVLADLSAAGLDRAEIAWVSTVRFYVRSCGARVGRTSVVLGRDLAPLPARIASNP